MKRKKQKEKDSSQRVSYISFFNSQKQICPICGHDFQREELLTGRGRLNAAKLTDELHRLFHPSEKFGQIYPLIYSIWSCPACYYSVLGEDFGKPKQEVLRNLGTKVAQERRKEVVEKVFGDINFADFRRLEEGISAYIVSIYCYEYFPQNQAPILKQGICAVRAAWLAVHLHFEQPQQNYDYLARILYRKAAYFYNRAIELHDKGEQALTTNAIVNYGPDVDHNFGMDSAIYLASVLQYRYGQRSNAALRRRRLQQAKIMISRLVGSGRVSQRKPSVILSHSRDLYKKINQDIKDMELE